MKATALIWLSIFFLSFVQGFAEEMDCRLDGQAEPNTYIHGCVNAITGSFIYSFPDIVVDGPETLSFVRHYCSNNSHDRDFGEGFSHNHATNTKKKSRHSMEIEDSGGDRFYFSALPKKEDDLCFYLNPNQLRKGYTNCSGGKISGRSNIKNTTLFIPNEEKNTSKSGKCTAYLGDGTQRFYNKDCLMTHEIRPSGNIIHYTYDKKKRIERMYATDSTNQTMFSWMDFSYERKRVVHVKASNGKEGTYYLKKHGEKHDREYTLSCCFIKGEPKIDLHYTSNQYVGEDRKNRVLKGIQWEEGDSIDLAYSHNKVEAIYLPGDRDKSTKVYEINYHTGKDHTTVKDVYGGKAIYSYTDKLRLSTKERYHEDKLYSREEFYWGAHRRSGSRGKPLKDDEGYLLTKGIANANKELLAVTTYTYDECGNVLSETFAGNLTGNAPEKPIKIIDKKPLLTGHETFSKYFTYSHDGFNLVTSIREKGGILQTFQYLPNTDKLSRKLTYSEGAIVSREFFEYNHLTIVTRKVVDDGASEEIDNLYGVNQRLITRIVPNMELGSPGYGKPISVSESFWNPDTGLEQNLKRVDYTYCQYDMVESEAHYDAENQLQYILTYKYDPSGNCIEKTDPLGRTMQFKYNKAKRCVYQELLGSGFSTSYIYDKRGRLIKTDENHKSGESFVRETKYDLLNRKVADIDPFRNITSYKYDDLGRLIKITHPASKSIEEHSTPSIEFRSYNIWDQLIEEKDPCGHLTRRQYNSRGQVTEIEYPDGTLESYRYNLDGTLHKKTNKNHSYSLLSYDGRKRLIREDTYSAQGELLRFKEFHYKGNNLTFEVDPLGNVTEYKYDGAGRKIAQIKHGDHQTQREEYLYDSLGRPYVLRKWFGEGNEAYTQNIKDFDHLNRVIEERVEDFLGKVFSKIGYSYDINGNCSAKITYLEEDRRAVQETKYTTFNLPQASIDALGFVTHFEYDFNYRNELGQKVFKQLVTDPKGIQTITIQDIFGRVDSVEKRNASNELLSTERFFYDARGLKLRHISDVIVGGKKQREYQVRWTYDSLGRVIEVVEDPSGKNKCTLMTYTPLGNLETKTKPDGVKLWHGYDALGREIEVQSSDGSISYSYEYDLNDHLLHSIDHVNGLNLSREYDSLGNLILDSFSNGCSVSLQYDEHQRITDFTLPDGSGIQYEYDPLFMSSAKRISNQGDILYAHVYGKKNLEGRSLQSTMITGDEIQFEWDPLGRLVSMQSPYASEEVPQNGYDSIGNLLQVKFTGGWGSDTEHYKYDHLNQLVYEDNLKTHHYSHDSLNNRLEKDQHQYDLNSINQVEHDGESSYCYDTNGNLISQESNGKITYQYDALNRLVSVTKDRNWRVHYGYDSYGRCIHRKKYSWTGDWVENEYSRFIFQGLHEIGSLDPEGKVQELRVLGQKEGVLFRLAVAVELNETVYAPIYDHRFNVIALIDFKTKLPAETYRYSAYGDVAIYGNDTSLKSSSETGNPWLYGSKRYDPLTDLYNFGKRYYRLALGRWISPDPGDFIDGLNLYAYTHNRPMICTDFYGFQTTSFWGEVGRYLEIGVRNICPSSPLQYMGEGVARTMQGKSFSHEFTGNLKPISGIVGDKDMGNKLVRMFTGIMTDGEEAKNHAEYFSGLLGGGEVHYSCNQTKGLCTDLFVAAAEYLDFGKLSIKEVYRDIIQDYHVMKARYGEDFSLHYSAHSRGALELDLLSSYLPKEIKNKINVYTLGAAKLISKGDFNKAVNYVNNDDLVVTIGKLGTTLLGVIASPLKTINETFFDKPEVVYTSYSSDSLMSPINDHYLDCPGYQKTLKDISDGILGKR